MSADASHRSHSGQGGAVSPQPNYIYYLADDDVALGVEDAPDGAQLIATSIDCSVLAGTDLLDALADVNGPYAKQEASSAYNWHLASINAYEVWATVTGDKSANRVAGGTVEITAVSGAASITKTVTVFDISFSMADTPSEIVGEVEIEVGDTLRLVFNEKPDTGLWHIESSDTSVMASNIASNGIIVVTGLSAGEACLTATLHENANLAVRLKVNVCDVSTKRSLESSRVSVRWPFITYIFGRAICDSSCPYTGFPIRPEPTVTYRMGNCSGATTVTLQLGSDYAMSYENNEDAGKATATITGTGSYEGAVSKTFGIAQRPPSKTSISGLSDVHYTGSPLEPVPIWRSPARAVRMRWCRARIYAYDNNMEVSANTESGYATINLTGLGISRVRGRLGSRSYP